MFCGSKKQFVTIGKKAQIYMEKENYALINVLLLNWLNLMF